MRTFMSEPSIRVRIHGRVRCVRTLLIGVLLAAGTAASAEELGTRPISWAPRVAVGECLSVPGSLLVNKRPGEAWQTLGDKEDVMSRDLLLAPPGAQAIIETRPKTVRLTLRSNLPSLSLFPGLQSAVILHDSRAFDLDFTLHRGQVVLTNRKAKGAARVWMRIEGDAFQLTLAEPGDAVLMGLYGFWPRGVSFTATPKPQDVPSRSLTFVLLKGQLAIKAGGNQHSLSAPDGPVYFHWDSVDGADEGPQGRKRLPRWAEPNGEIPRGKVVAAVVDKFEKLAKNQDPRTALDALLAAAEKERDKERADAMTQFAVYGLAAINEMDRLMQILGDSKQAAVRQTAVVALRRWIGDAPGQDQRLYQFLLDKLGYSRAQAMTVLQLLHSPFASNDPESYETLIAYLRHESQAVRELAWWHLSRLVPKEFLIPYDPAGTEAERAKAQAAWRELVPSGSVPRKKPQKK
jgi:hypothetical protein